MGVRRVVKTILFPKSQQYLCLSRRERKGKKKKRIKFERDACVNPPLHTYDMPILMRFAVAEDAVILAALWSILVLKAHERRCPHLRPV